MRDNWKKYQIKDIIKGLYDGPHATPAPSEKGAVFLGVKNLTEDGRIDISEIRHIAEEDFPRWTKRVLPKNDDIVFTYEASLHRYGLLKDDLRCCLGRRMALLRLDKSIVYPQFLLYYFLSPEWRQTVERNIIVGATVNRIPISEFSSFELSLPNYNEQIDIAKVLSGIDQKITLNTRINTELESMAKLLYDYWFVQFDFPDAEGKPYKSSGGKMVYSEALKREIPAGWESGTLGDLGTIIGGSTPSKKVIENFCKDGMPWITPKDLSMNAGKKFITRGELDASDQGVKSASLKILPKGTVLLSSRAPIGYMVIARNDLTTNQGFKSFVPDKDFPTPFIYYAVKASMKRIEKNASGSTFKEISGGALKVIPVCLPSSKVINEFIEKVNSIFKRQDLLELENEQLANLRDWLLPMLMNGQVRVEDVAYEMGEAGYSMAAEPDINYGEEG